MTDKQLEQYIHKATKASNKEQKALVDKYDRIEKYLKEFNKTFWPITMDFLTDSGVGSNGKVERVKEEINNFLKSSLLSYGEEVRKEVLEEVENKLPEEQEELKIGLNYSEENNYKRISVFSYNYCLNTVKKIINSMK